ncbi:TetR/AcrR family transcriptional regulator [Streptomyces sp. NPDC050759]|uniref:TetR/AcrR family transcriptional regulator n=1 Tax=Streptomyces sp. NPDC050759 TaxID=3365635 RepID=UPI0037887D00
MTPRQGPRSAGEEQPGRQKYFSPEQRDTVEDGCPNAALLDEIARSTDTTRQAYTDGALTLIDGFVARSCPPHDPPSARLTALSLLGLLAVMMAGTLQLSRALTDRQLADHLLEQGIHNALALVDA